MYTQQNAQSNPHPQQTQTPLPSSTGYYPPPNTQYPSTASPHPPTTAPYPSTATPYPNTATNTATYYPPPNTQYPSTASQYPPTTAPYQTTATPYPNTAASYYPTASYPTTTPSYPTPQYSTPSTFTPASSTPSTFTPSTFTPATPPTATSTPVQQQGKSTTTQHKINPTQIPSPISALDAKNKIRYHTKTSSTVPSATSQFTAVDEGNCSPRFMRMTLYNVPCTADLLSTSHLPLGVIIQPLAELAPEEEMIPLIDFGEAGPIRCQRCRAYINPFAQFIDGGKNYICRLCDFINEVPKDYFCPLEPNGRRHDVQSRAELSRGSVEFVASKEYIERPVAAPCYLFLIDVSYNSLTSGMLTACIDGIKSLLSQLSADSAVRIGLLTFDTSVHFYNLRSTRQQAQMMVIADVNGVFVPVAPEALFVRYADSKNIIDTLLDKLPFLFEHNKSNESALGSALRAAAMALESTGGKLLVFQSSLPSVGVGKLKKRDDVKVMGTDKEKQLYQAQDGFYSEFAAECVKQRISVDLFLFPSAFIDTATLGVISKLTGGQLYYYPSFSLKRHSHKFQAELHRNFTRCTGFDALMRLRCSRGLTVGNQYGNYNSSTGIDLELASIDTDKSFCIELKHDDKLDEKSEAVLQCALLYTASNGQRRIRVHTLAISCTNLLGNLFRNADCEAILNFFARTAMSESHKQSIATMRTGLIEKCVDILYVYRKYCATSTSSGQLILPESLKLLPIYILSLIKNTVLKQSADIHADERAYLFSLLNSMPVALSTPFIYPRLFALHHMSPECGTYDEEGMIRMPPLARLAQESLTADGVFLLENGQQMYLWLGRAVSTQLLHDLFNVTTPVEYLNSAELSIAATSSEHAQRVCNILDSIRKQRQTYQELQIVKAGEVLEQRFFALLVEDKLQDTMSYVDFLCHVHKQIQTKLS